MEILFRLDRHIINIGKKRLKIPKTNFTPSYLIILSINRVVKRISCENRSVKPKIDRLIVKNPW